MSSPRRRQRQTDRDVNYLDDFENEEDLTPSQKLDRRLKEDDSSFDGSDYKQVTSPSASEQDSPSPPRKKYKPTFIPSFIPPLKKKPAEDIPSIDLDEDQETETESFEEIARRLEDKGKENIPPKTTGEVAEKIDGPGASFNMLNSTNKMSFNLLKRKSGKYNSELLKKVIKKTADVMKEKEVPYSKVKLRFTELVIAPLLQDKILIHQGKSMRDFSSRWSRLVCLLINDEEGEDLDQFYPEELPEVLDSLEVIKKTVEPVEEGEQNTKAAGDGKKKRPVSMAAKEAFLPSGLDIGDVNVSPTKEFGDPRARSGYKIREMAVMNNRIPPRSKELLESKDKLDKSSVEVCTGAASTMKGVAKSRVSTSDKLDSMTNSMTDLVEKTHKERMMFEERKLSVFEKLTSPKVEDKTIVIVCENVEEIGYPIKFSDVDQLKKEIMNYCGIRDPIRGIIIDAEGRQVLLRFQTQITAEMEKKNIKIKSSPRSGE